MTYEIGDRVQFERDGGKIVNGTASNVKGREPYRVIGVRGRGAAENYLIPERFLTAAAASR